jgi:hypothetical protein
MPPERSNQQNTSSKGRRTLWAALGIALLAVALMGSGSLPNAPSRSRYARAYPGRPLTPVSDAVATLLPPPPVDDEYFPCSDCHEDELADPRPRELDEHDDIELAHGDLWCLDCHQSDERDLLHLSDASPVEMAESWRLCSRCHAKKMPEWRAGIHGKRTGNWWGPKEFWSCVVCHDPHAPLFKPLTPKPPPTPAGEIRFRTADEPELKEVADEQG